MRTILITVIGGFLGDGGRIFKTNEQMFPFQRRTVY